MTTPAHVQAWEAANRKRSYSAREAACILLLDEWMLKQEYWKVTAFGREWEGELAEVQHTPEVFFTLRVLDPSNPAHTLTIAAPFEEFTPVEKGN